jgi:cell division protein FtsL
MPARVEKIAIGQLQMQRPQSKQINYLRLENTVDQGAAR